MDGTSLKPGYVCYLPTGFLNYEIQYSTGSTKVSIRGDKTRNFKVLYGLYRVILKFELSVLILIRSLFDKICRFAIKLISYVLHRLS